MGAAGLPKVTAPGPEADQAKVRVPNSGSEEPVPSKPETVTPVVPLAGPVATATGGSANATEVMTGLTRRANAARSANADRPNCREAIAELLSLKYDNAVAPIPCFLLARRRAILSPESDDHAQWQDHHWSDFQLTSGGIGTIRGARPISRSRQVCD